VNEVDSGLRDIFIISVLLVIAVYFVGFSTDLATFGTALTGLINTATGRNAQGQFAGYPTGG
jgi:hypothetical protein